MSKWMKLINRIYSLSGDLRFEEIRKILEHYGYKVSSNGSSHFVFRKNNCNPITIPVHGKIKSKYVEMVRDVIEQEEKE